MAVENLTKQFLQSIEIIADKKLSTLNFNKTIEAKIISIDNLDKGEYSVIYQNNVFNVYSLDTSINYKINDTVYVNIQGGDFSKQRIIIGKSSNYTSTQDYDNNSQKILDAGPLWDKWYNIEQQQQNGQKWGIASAENGSQSYAEIIIYQNDNNPNSQNYHDSGHDMFLLYSKEYQNFRLTADFRTMFRGIHSQGNYGLKIDFYTSDPEQEEVSFTFDINNFYGDFYNYTSWSEQSIIIQAVDKGYLTGLKKISLFKEKFQPDIEEIYDYNADNQLQLIENNEINIQVSNIKLQFIEIINLTEIDYYLNIDTPYGNIIRDNNIVDTDYKLYLQPSLLYYGQEIINPKNCEVKWFKRRGYVTAGIEGYDPNAGSGWEIVSPQSISQNDDFFGCLLFGDDYETVYFKETYKLVLIYNKESALSKEITVYNKNSEINFDILQRSAEDGKSIELYIADYNNKKKDETFFPIDEEVYDCGWYFEQPDKTYMPFEHYDTDNLPNNPIVQISDYLLQTYLNFWCDIRLKNSDNVICTLYYHIQKADIEEDLVVDFSVTPDISTFRYDADGNLSIKESEINRALNFNLTWAEGYGTIYSIRWYMKDSNGNIHTLSEGNEEHYKPINSMIKEIWVADKSKNLLNFVVNPRYKNSYTNNTVYLEITDKTNQKTYLYQKNFIFTKDGDQGTNGTPYVALIRWCDSSGKVLENEYHAYQTDKDSYITFEVYNDGQKMTDGYNIQSISSQNIVLTDTSNPNIKCLKKGQTIDLAQATYIKAQISITENIRSVLYPILNVDIADNAIDLKKVDINNISSSIIYSSTGVNPSFNNAPLNYEYNNINYDGKDIVPITADLISIISKTQTKDEDDTQTTLYFLSPVSEFLFDEQKMGLIKIPTADGDIYHTIIMILNVYGNEAINGWDGTSIKLDDDGNYMFAPMIGAGKKDSGNTFTGVVMGQAPSGIVRNPLVGIYGFQKGINTFGLTEDGNAYFGSEANGRITIVGKEATIYGGKTKGSSNSMILRLSQSNGSVVATGDMGDNESTKAIEIIGSKSNVFYVDYSGYIKANAGKIANWTMNYLSADGGQVGYLTSGTTSSLVAQNTTTLFSDGRIYCKYIDASQKGIIGGWAFAPTTEMSDASTYTTNALVAVNGKSILNGNGRIGTTYFDIYDSSTQPYTVSNIRNSSKESLNITNNKVSPIGKLGFVTGNDGENNTKNVGLQTGVGYGIVFESGKNIRFSTKVHIWDEQGNDTSQETEYGSFFVDCPAEQQHGIYARFA